MHVHGYMVSIVLFKCNLYSQAKSVFYEAHLTLEFIFGYQSVAQSRIHHAHNCLSTWIKQLHVKHWRRMDRSSREWPGSPSKSRKEKGWEFLLNFIHCACVCVCARACTCACSCVWVCVGVGVRGQLVWSQFFPSTVGSIDWLRLPVLYGNIY